MYTVYQIFTPTGAEAS